MTAKRPETYQRESESLQRRLDISNYHLQKSEETTKDLKERLETQKDTANKERDWLRAKLKNNARSAAYWSKYRQSNTSRLAWGVRCACTEPETAYVLKDQTPRIVELEGIVAARDETISRLRASRWKVLINDDSSKSNPTETFLPSTPQPVKTTSVHNCEHEQNCKRLEKQAEDDAKTILQLRKDCQDLRDATSTEPAADVNTELQEEITKTRQELATKDQEIDDLRADKRSAEENAEAKISDLDQKLSDCRKELLNVHEVATERETELGRQKNKINEVEATQSQLKETIKQKDLEIEDLEEANQEIANRPAPESAETLQRLTTANTDLAELRHQYAECKEESETRSARINELEATQRGLEDSIEQKDAEITTANANLEQFRHQYAECRGQSETRSARINELEATMTVKNDRIATLEQQISTAPTTDLFERQIQSHAEAIYQKDQALRSLLAEGQKLQNAHSSCDWKLNDLASRLRQGSNAHTDLQVKYNTQTTELDAANKDVEVLQSRVATLQQANTTLEQRTSCSESEVEKYRLQGEDRIRPIWQATFDREVSVVTLKLTTSEEKVFKLTNDLKQAKSLASPLREMQLKAREDAVKAREDAVDQDTADVMDHDHQGGPQAVDQREVKSLQAQLGAAKKEVGDGRLRINSVQRQLTKEKKDRKEDKERHEREMRKGKEDFENRSKALQLRLEAENPLKRTVSKLQNEVAVLKNELKGRD